MRVQFVVHTTGLTGGIRVVFEYANRLRARGHDVWIVHALDVVGGRFPSRPSLLRMAKRCKFALRPRVGWFDVHVPVLRRPQILDRYLPPADVVFATANETADWVVRLDATRGEKFYLVQHDETWTRDPELVRATWSLPLKKIVIASWLEKLAVERGAPAVAMIPNGVNTEQFGCTERQHRVPPRILLLCSRHPWKGTADALVALEDVRRRGRRFDLTGFGTERFPGLPPGTRWVHAPTGEKLRRLYCEHDIFISPSWAEGCQLPPMEAMASGCAVVATNVGGIPDYAVADRTALVVEPRQPEALAATLERCLDDPALVSRIAAAGREHIGHFTWERATDRLEGVLRSHVRA